MELPFPKLNMKAKSSIRENTEIRRMYTSPILDQYQNVAAMYKSYINDLSPKIEKIYQKENYRDYLKEQKLNMIKSQLCNKKEVLEKQLEEKLDPTKSANGKLHIEINSLTQLETNYKSVLAEIEKNIKEKQEQISCLQGFVQNQKQNIKGLLKYELRQTQEKLCCKLPRIKRKNSQQSFWSRDSGKSIYKPSRQSIISKLSSSIMDKTSQRVNLQEQKLIMLKLFIVYFRTEAQPGESSFRLIESLDKQLIVREELIKDIKKEMSELQAEKKVEVKNE